MIGVGRDRRQRAAIDAIPDLVEQIVVAVRSGATPYAAIGSVTPPAALAATLAEVNHRLRRGSRLADALQAFHLLGPGAAAFVDTLAAADRYGLALGPVLDRLADDIRSERRRIAAERARTLPVKLAFPLVVCTLPAFVLVAIVPALLGALSALDASTP